MYYAQTCAAKGTHGSNSRQMLYRSMERAAVNIYRTDNSYEMLVFAPGRIREHFQVHLEGDTLTVSYHPPDGFPRPDWVRREYSRGGFVRHFTLGAGINGKEISAEYVDGVLNIHLPFLQGEEKAKHNIEVK